MIDIYADFKFDIIKLLLKEQARKIDDDIWKKNKDVFSENTEHELLGE